jgi:phage terminase large subunit
MPNKIITHEYKPREIFLDFHARKQRWAIEVVHRRGGKTVATINDTINRILYFTPPKIQGIPSREPGRYAYVAPFLNQARQIAWDYVKRYSATMLKKPPSEAELSVTYFNDCKLTLYGADNPDSFRGQYFDGVDLDEYGLMKPSIWGEVLLPTLVDRKGWATFIGTPNGPNHFRTLVRLARADPQRWFFAMHKASETGLIPQEELDEMRKLMLPEEYEQEMECSFEASARGAFYSMEVAAAEREERIRPLNPNKDMPLHFIFDLGYRDDTATIAFQDAVDAYPIIHAESDNLRPIRHYINRIHEICLHYDCARGNVWLPHDAKAKTLQTGRSIVEQFVAAGIKPMIVPNLDVIDGIAAARMLFPEIYFNAALNGLDGPCAELVEALKTYRRKWDEDKKAFDNQPIHDWSSHYADVFRYFGIVAKKQTLTREEEAEDRHPALIHYPFSLEDLYGELENGRFQKQLIR